MAKFFASEHSLMQQTQKETSLRAANPFEKPLSEAFF